MDEIRLIPTSLPAGIAPTYKALLPHLKANADNIKKQYSKRETHSYGPDRQDLDIYYPHESSSKSPVLLFLYGGGFFMGDKRHPQLPDLIYANLGAFFANKGFITIVADYRLSKGPGNETGTGRYPSGGEDIALALKWISENLGADRNVFLMGNSAGAVHVMTFLFEPSLKNSAHAKVAGAVLVSAPCHQLNADAERAPVNEAYYGTAEAVYSNSPIGLVIRNGVVSIPILSLIAELDEDGIIKSCADFKAEYVKQGGKIDEIIMEGHNHISPVPALNSTEEAGSKWGEDSAEWMMKQVK